MSTTTPQTALHDAINWMTEPCVWIGDIVFIHSRKYIRKVLDWMTRPMIWLGKYVYPEDES